MLAHYVDLDGFVHNLSGVDHNTGDVDQLVDVLGLEIAEGFGGFLGDHLELERNGGVEGKMGHGELSDGLLEGAEDIRGMFPDLHV